MDSKVFSNKFVSKLFKKLTKLSSLKSYTFYLFFITSFVSVSYTQEAYPVDVKALFNTNCASCHKLDRKMTGPALRYVEKRLAEDEGLDREWLYSWIRNSSAMIKSGDPYAVKIYEEYNKSAMTAYPQLTNADIDNILAYTAQDKAVPKPTAVATNVAVGPTNGLGLTDEIILGVFTVLFLLLSIGLVVVTKTLRTLAELKGVKLKEKKKTKPIWKAYLENQFLMLCTAILFLLVSAYGFYGSNPSSLIISYAVNIPVVFDTHHYECYNILHKDEDIKSPDYYIPSILDTWKKKNIKPKFHISEQGSGKIGHHSDYIEVVPDYLLEIPEKYGIEIDIMIEAKFKELAVIEYLKKHTN